MKDQLGIEDMEFDDSDDDDVPLGSEIIVRKKPLTKAEQIVPFLEVAELLAGDDMSEIKEWGKEITPMLQTFVPESIQMTSGIRNNRRLLKKAMKYLPILKVLEKKHNC